MKLKEILQNKGISVYQAAKDMDIPYSTLNDLVIEKTDIKKTNAEMLHRISVYLNLTMEALYNSSEDTELVIYIYNDNRTIFLDIKSSTIKQTCSYMGPKNLIGFHRITNIQDNVIYVQTYFSDNGMIYEEEDYIDLADVLGDYNLTALLANDYKVILGKADSSEKDKLIDLALLVSDNLALVYVEDNAYPYDCIEIINLSRTTYRMLIRLDTMDILRTNMSKSMSKRAVDALTRNQDLIKDEIEKIHKEKKYA